MNAYLELEDGTRVHGTSFGAEKSVCGEVVFNTGMTGYPEAFTDPSYKGQILVLTYPLIGNYGVPEDKITEGLSRFESGKIQISGLIVSEYCEKYSHHDAKKSLGKWLEENEVPALSGIPTRELTIKLREKGVMLGKIIRGKDIQIEDPNLRNLVAEVSTHEKKVYGNRGKKIVLIDCGAKNNIIRCLLEKNVTVIRVPWNYNFHKEDYDAVMVSNGPGDPKMCKETIANISKALEKQTPVFGICLGNQLLALAAGGDTYKLKYGHRSQNQPCINLETKRCYITTQNHGFAVNMKSMPSGWEELFVNANDGTNEGLRHKNKPFFSVQFHPEHTPGPTDAQFLFEEFIKKL